MDDYKTDEQAIKDFEYVMNKQIEEDKNIKEDGELDANIPELFEQIEHAYESTSENLAEVSIHELYSLSSSCMTSFLEFIEQAGINFIEFLDKHYVAFPLNDVIIADVLYILSTYAQSQKQLISELVELGYYKNAQELSKHENKKVAISSLRMMSILIEYVAQNCEDQIKSNDIAFAETIMNEDRWGTFYLARIVYFFLRYCSYSKEELKLMIHTAESIRNASEDSEYYADCIVCHICSLLLEKDPNNIYFLTRSQLQGGVIETIEDQYDVFGLTNLESTRQMVLYQQALFDLIHLEFSLFPDVAALYFIEINTSFIKNVIQISNFNVVSKVIDIVSNVMELNKYNDFTQKMISTKLFETVATTHFDDSFDAKVTAIHYLSSCIHYSDTRMWREVIEFDYIQNASFVLDYDESSATLHLYLRSIVDLLNYGNEIEDNSINEILDDPSIMEPIIGISEHCEIPEIVEISKQIILMMT